MGFFDLFRKKEFKAVAITLKYDLDKDTIKIYPYEYSIEGIFKTEANIKEETGIFIADEFSLYPQGWFLFDINITDKEALKMVDSYFKDKKEQHRELNKYNKES